MKNTKTSITEKALSSAAKKMKKELEAAFKEVKLHQEGKIQLKTARELLDEL